MAVLVVLLALTIAFLVSRLFYGWVGKVGLQSVGFSPTLASTLTAPILAFGYGLIAQGVLFEWPAVVGELALVPPIPVLALLLGIYLGGGFRGRKALILWAAIASLPILEVLWIFVFLRDLE